MTLIYYNVCMRLGMNVYCNGIIKGDLCAVCTGND